MKLVSKAEILLVGGLNAAVIGYLVHSAGGEHRMALLAITAVAIGSAGGLIASNWLEENGYSMRDK